MIQIEIEVVPVDGKDLGAVRFEIADNDEDLTGAEKAIAAFLRNQFENLIDVAGGVNIDMLAGQKPQ